MKEKDLGGQSIKGNEPKEKGMAGGDVVVPNKGVPRNQVASASEMVPS